MLWKEAFQQSRYRWALVFCAGMMLNIVFYMPHFYQDIILPRQGSIPWDPVLTVLPPRDWSLITFLILYVSIGQTLISHFRSPRIVMVALTAYCGANLIRMATMYLFTFEPPPGMILLVDPISSIAYPDSAFAKDLFFSGHVSTVMILVLVEPLPLARRLKAAGTILMAVLLAWQHVHYTIDILFAPLFSYAFYRLALLLLNETPDQGPQHTPVD